jgi:hypothetical protein
MSISRSSHLRAVDAGNTPGFSACDFRGQRFGDGDFRQFGGHDGSVSEWIDAPADQTRKILV